MSTFVGVDIYVWRNVYPPRPLKRSTVKLPKKEKNLKLVNGKWICDLTIRGKRIREFAGYTKDEARNTLAKLRLINLDSKLGISKPIKQDAPFSEFAEEFLELYSKPNKRSWRRDEFSLKSLKQFFKGESLQSLGAEKIERFKMARRSAVSAASVNRELACLKTLLSKAVEWGRLENNPAAKIKKFREPGGRERILSPEESRRLIEAASPELRPIILVALGTGMRLGEILSLERADIDFTRGIITIARSKSGRGRKVPMSGSVAAALGALPRRGDHVFYNPETGTHIKGVTRSFKSACRRANIAGVRMHDCRHTFASRALELGADIMTVSKILGHSSIQMTSKYLHPTGESMRLAVERMAETLGRTRQKDDMAKIESPVTVSKDSH
jgi:integrase